MRKQSLTTWIKNNRDKRLTAAPNVLALGARKNDTERRLWALNGKGLYRWARSERVNI